MVSMRAPHVRGMGDSFIKFTFIGLIQQVQNLPSDVCQQMPNNQPRRRQEIQCQVVISKRGRGQVDEIHR